MRFLDTFRRSVRSEVGARRAKLYGVEVSRPSVGVLTIGPTTTGALFVGFAAVAKEKGLRLPFEGPKQLGQRASNAHSTGLLAAAGWVRTTAGKAHRNKALYRFTYGTVGAKHDAVDNIVQLNPAIVDAEGPVRAPESDDDVGGATAGPE